MTEQHKNQPLPQTKEGYEKPAVEKKLAKEDLEKEFLYAGAPTNKVPIR